MPLAKSLPSRPWEKADIRKREEESAESHPPPLHMGA